MFETLFGSEMPLAARFFIAFLVVLALIGATAWLVRRFGANRLGGANTRGRQPRLAVIDAASVDARRRLVLIRRDNIEHLLMIGGPTDLVVEPNIVRAVGSREVTREPGRIEPSVRPTAAVENSWPLQPSSEPTPVPPPRNYRAPAIEDPWHAPEPGGRARPAEGLSGLSAEISARHGASDHTPAPPVRSEPALRASAPPVVTHEPPASAQTDHNLAEMAQQLEAALRRMPENRAPVTDPLAAKGASPAKAAAPRDFEARLEPKFEAQPEAWPEPKFDANPEPKFDSKPETTFEPKFESKPEPKVDSRATPGKNLYDNLEQEMASLLGRPSGKT
jgi:flagellar protein FliO/FliZ